MEDYLVLMALLVGAVIGIVSAENTVLQRKIRYELVCCFYAD